MTKLLITVSALALAAPAFAQTTNNNSTVNQSGTNGRATVDQSAGTKGTSKIDQNGDRNQASVTQNGGSGNRATVDQDDAAAQRNQSTSTQNGVNGVVSVKQRDKDNRSVVTQNSGATATVDQSDSLGRNGFLDGANNDSNITQMSNAGGATATVTQDGTLNGATIVQDADATAIVDQTNIFNKAFVNQNAGAAGAMATVTQGGAYGDNEARVTQNANATATVTQSADSTSNRAPTNLANVTQDATNGDVTVDQTGDNNTATATQFADAVGAMSTIKQNGAGNTASATQDAAASSNIEQGVFGGGARVNNDNTATVNQFANATDAVSDINQAGSRNTTTVSQDAKAGSYAFTYGNGNDVTVEQAGVNSISLVVQGNSSGQDANDNSATVRQLAGATNATSYVGQVEGNRNTADITMSGASEAKAGAPSYSAVVNAFNNGTLENTVLQANSDNSVTVNQAADNAQSNVFQGVDSGFGSQGGGNTAFVTQNASADQSTSEIFQGGTSAFSRNSATVTQGGLGGTNRITQLGDRLTSDLNQSGDDNENTTDQTGENNLISIIQSGATNIAMTTQSGSGNTANVTQITSGNMSTITQSGTGATATVTQ